jgi:predicted phosphodiesterase
LTCGIRYNSLGAERIKKGLEFFEKEKCDLIICLGDLIDCEAEHSKEIENLTQLSEILSKCSTPIFAVMGNHDGFAFDVDEFYGILGERFRPKNIFGDKNLIFLDACFFKNGEHYKRGDHDWTDTYLPRAEKLNDILKNAIGDTFIFIHQNLDPEICENHRLYNDGEVRDILEKSGKVKTVFQGHYHLGHESTCQGIKYITYPALCENENALFVTEI